MSLARRHALLSIFAIRSQTIVQVKAAYADARARRMTALAEAEQLRLQATRGELVRRDSVSLAVTSLLSATKNHVLGIASKVSHALVGITDRRVVHKLIYDECERSLRELSDASPEKITAGPQSKLFDLQNQSLRPSLG